MADRMPQRIRESMEYVICGPEMNTHTTSSFSANSFSALDLDHAWDFERFCESFRIGITALDAERMEFDLVGVHPSIANALRRIMLSEVPTMAIEHVYFVDNTGVVQVLFASCGTCDRKMAQDEVLAHRLGLVPIQADPRFFEWRREDEASNERNCIVFKLDVTCQRHKRQLLHANVKSGDLTWLPGGSEMPDETNCRFTSNQSVALMRENRPAKFQSVHDDILLTKLRTQQVVQLEAHCFKGIGKDHAKWSPVATAWYRLRPEVVLLREVQGQKAQFLAEQFAGLFVTEKKPGTEIDVARVRETRGHEHYLEQIRRMSGEKDWEKKIQLRKQKDYFLFTIESVGQYRPDEILLEAVDILILKCDKLINAL